LPYVRLISKLPNGSTRKLTRLFSDFRQPAADFAQGMITDMHGEEQGDLFFAGSDEEEDVDHRWPSDSDQQEKNMELDSRSNASLDRLFLEGSDDEDTAEVVSGAVATVKRKAELETENSNGEIDSEMLSLEELRSRDSSVGSMTSHEQLPPFPQQHQPSAKKRRVSLPAPKIAAVPLKLASNSSSRAKAS
jgi:hypothetical protein